MLKNIVRTTCDEHDGKHLWERFTTKGVVRDSAPFSSFICHYYINQIPRTEAFTDDLLLSWARSTDMIRVTGIRLSLDVGVSPKSGWRVRLMLVQSPLDFYGLTGEVDMENGSYDGDDDIPQGGYNLNGNWFTRINNTPNGVEAAISPTYKELFKFQRKTYDHLSYADDLQKLKVTHPHAKVIYEKRLLYINKKKDNRRYQFNYLIPSRTTWKYPYTVHDGRVDGGQPPIPDRKVFCFIIATPIFGGVEDPGQNMFDAGGGPIERGAAQHRRERAGSVVRGEFGQAAVPGEGPPMEPVPMDQQVDPVPAEALPGDPPIVLNQRAEDLRQAMRANREDARREREAERQAHPPPVKPPKPPKLETNEYGWAYDQTIMIRPIFDIYWKNMPLKRVGYR
jgi:hypothetical protein